VPSVESLFGGLVSSASLGQNYNTSAITGTGGTFVEQLASALGQSSTSTTATTSTAAATETAPTWRDFIVGKTPADYYPDLTFTPTKDVPSGYAAGPYRHQLEGFNAAKFDPAHPESMTMKMISARIFEQFDVYSPTAIDDVVKAFNDAGIKATKVGIDQIDFHNGKGTIDVIRNKQYLEGDTSKGMAWQWLKVGEGWKTGTPTTTTGIPPMNNPYIPSTTGGQAIDLSQVTWLHENVSSWPVTSSLSASVGNGKISLDHSKAGDWPVLDGGSSADVEGNAWVFVNRGGRWYGATWEWLRPGQTSKTMSAEDLGDHIKKEPLKSWTPQPGEQVGFMVSTPARDSRRTSNERSNIAMTTWPA
jgi:hypothetical protein